MLLRGVMMNRLFHRRDPLGGLKPAFAVAVETIDPVLAIGRRLAGLRQALLFGGSLRGGFRRSRSGLVEQGGEGIRECRRRRKTCEKKKSGEAKSQMTGHGNPRCCAPPRGMTLGRDLGRNATQMRRCGGFILGQEPGSRPIQSRSSSRALSRRHSGQWPTILALGLRRFALWPSSLPPSPASCRRAAAASPSDTHCPSKLLRGL
jgi:hypothetical protein